MPFCPPLLLVASTTRVGVRAFETKGWYTKKKSEQSLSSQQSKLQEVCHWVSNLRIGGGVTLLITLNRKPPPVSAAKANWG